MQRHAHHQTTKHHHHSHRPSSFVRTRPATRPTGHRQKPLMAWPGIPVSSSPDAMANYCSRKAGTVCPSVCHCHCLAQRPFADSSQVSSHHSLSACSSHVALLLCRRGAWNGNCQCSACFRCHPYSSRASSDSVDSTYRSTPLLNIAWLQQTLYPAPACCSLHRQTVSDISKTLLCRT